MELIAQILGLVGVLFTVLTYQMNTNQKVLLTQGASAVCFFLNYLLLGAYPGAALNLVSVARNYAFGAKNDKSISKNSHHLLPIAIRL